MGVGITTVRGGFGTIRATVTEQRGSMPRSINPVFHQDISRLPPDKLWTLYETCLRQHDWTYEYSDDFQIWQLGRDEREYVYKLRDTLSELDSNRAYDMYYKNFKKSGAP